MVDSTAHRQRCMVRIDQQLEEVVTFLDRKLQVVTAFYNRQKQAIGLYRNLAPVRTLEVRLGLYYLPSS